MREDINNFFNWYDTLPSIYIFLACALVVVLFHIAIYLFFIAGACTNRGKVGNLIRETILYNLDFFADVAESKKHNKELYDGINSLLGWRRIIIPAVLIKLVIQFEVWYIRKVQSTTCKDQCNLHQWSDKEDE